MAKKIFGSLQAGNISINGKYAMRYFNGIPADPNTGNVNFKYYKKDEVKNILGMLPISRIGTLDYLPMSVSGSYVGATSYSDVKRIQPCILEDDGTMVILRAGTNGSSSGFYYAYLKNARNIIFSNNDVVQSNNEFKPSFFINGDFINDFMPTNGNELLLFSYNRAGISNYAVSLTRGSFNPVLHTSLTIPYGKFGTDAPRYAHIVGNRVFFWCRPSVPETNLACNFTLYSISIDDIENNNTAIPSFTTHTGFSGQTVLGRNYSSSSYIPVWDAWASTGSTSLFKIQGSVLNTIEYMGYNGYNITAKGSPDGSKIRVALFPSYRGGSPYGVSAVYGLWLNFTYDLNTNQVVMENGNLGQIVSDATYDGVTFSYNEVNPYSINMINANGFSNALGNTGTICQSDDNFFVSTKSRWISSPEFLIAKGKAQGSSVYDSLRYENRIISGHSQLGVQPVYGSAVGDNLIGPRFIKNDKILLACSGTYDNLNYGYDSIVSTGIGTDTTFVYNKLNGTTINGYAPQSNRVKEDNSNHFLTGLITLTDLSGNVNVYGTSFIAGLKNTAGYKLNPDTMTFDTTYTMSDTVLNNIKNSVITAAGYQASGNTSHISFYYVPDSTYSKSFAMCTLRIGTTSTGYLIVAECDAVLSSNSITGATVSSTKVTLYPNNFLDTGTKDEVMRLSGMNIAKYAGFNFIGVDFLSSIYVPGNTWYNGMIGKIKSGTLQSQWFYQNNYIPSGGTQHVNIPGTGFGTTVYDNTINDIGTKLVVKIYGNTESDLDTLISSNGSTGIKSTLVLVSQEVPENYNVYFTQEIPVFIAGIQYDIPPTSIDLNTIDPSPANKTFYLYVQMDTSTDTASYQVSTTALDEQLTLVYIGKITTGVVGIESIVTEKVTRFLTYRPSTTKRGSAIPCSDGVPALPGTRWN